MSKTGKQRSVTAARTAITFDDCGIVPLYRHPVFFAFLLFLALFVLSFIGMTIFCTMSSSQEQNLPSFKGEVVSPAPRSVSLSAGSDDEATTLLREALLTQGDQRRELFQKLIDTYPTAPESLLVSPEYARLEEANQARLEEIQKKEEERRAKAEQDGKAAWEAAQKLASNHGKYLPLLKDIIARFPGTQAAQDADAALQKIAPAPKPAQPAQNIPVKQPAPAKPLPAKPAPGKAEPAKTAPKKPAPVNAADSTKWAFPFTSDSLTNLPLMKFTERYHQALTDWDLPSAKALADSLAASQKFPQISNFGKACAQDVAALQTFEDRVSEYFRKHIKKPVEVTLVRSKESKLQGVLQKVDGGTMVILQEGRFPRPVPFPLGLNAEYLFSIYEHSKGEKDPDPLLIKALYFYATDNDFAVKDFFQKLGRHDPLGNVHAELLRRTYEDIK